MTAQKPTLDSLNRATEAEFVATLGGIYEHSPWIAEAAFSQRPFASLEALKSAMQTVVASATTERKLALINAHPDLAGKAAQEGTMTTDSKSEQGGIGLDRLSKDQFSTFQRLNAAYREKFNFPFIVCVRMHNSKESILHNFEARLRNDRSTEFETALQEISMIAGLRLQQLIA